VCRCQRVELLGLIVGKSSELLAVILHRRDHQALAKYCAGKAAEARKEAETHSLGVLAHSIRTCSKLDESSANAKPGCTPSARASTRA
jgi:hypothetical protein